MPALCYLFYKIHICIQIQYWKKCFDALLRYYNLDVENTISQFKFPLNQLKQVKDKRILYKYIENFDGGTALANFIIYPNIL